MKSLGVLPCLGLFQAAAAVVVVLVVLVVEVYGEGVTASVPQPVRPGSFLGWLHTVQFAVSCQAFQHSAFRRRGPLPCRRHGELKRHRQRTAGARVKSLGVLPCLGHLEAAAAVVLAEAACAL